MVECPFKCPSGTTLGGIHSVSGEL
jgi:hypothetical protein